VKDYYGAAPQKLQRQNSQVTTHPPHPRDGKPVELDGLQVGGTGKCISERPNSYPEQQSYDGHGPTCQPDFGQAEPVELMGVETQAAKKKLPMTHRKEPIHLNVNATGAYLGWGFRASNPHTALATRILRC
jgi:hypothetical protein